MNIGQPVPCISDSACKLSASASLNDTQHKPCKDFPRIDSAISYEDFFVNYLLPNKPCIFDSFITDSWRGCKEWVGKNGLPDFAFLRENFGSVTVPVANCGQEEYSAHPKQDMLLSEYVDYIIQYKQSQYSPDQPCLYLKDWHFNRDFPRYEAYSTPVYFRSDWLNEFWDLREDIDDDYRFVYIGPKGSWTSFHADVFRSYSWSANICGRKKWIFYFPGEEEKLKDKFGNLIYDVTEPIDMLKYPKSSQIQHRYEVIQESGEVIFVPCGWHHQVFNLEDTISVNHNWLNGCCIENSWRFIKSSLAEVEKEISDCKEMDNWYQQCQLILKASSGINYTEFLQFMKTIADNRIKQLHKYIQSDNGVCDDDELDLLCDLLTNTTVCCQNNDNLCCDRLTQKEDMCCGTQKEDDVCFGTQKEDDVCFGTHKEDDVCFGTHKEDDVCFGTQKEDDVCFGTQKEDDVCFGTQKEDDVCFGTQKEDDVCFGTHKEDDVCFGTHKEDDVCFGTQKEDDVCFGTQKEDDVCFGTQKEDDVCFGTQKEDDVCFGTQKEDDVCFGTQKEDDVCFGTQKEDDVCFGTQKEDDVCFGTQKEDDVCFGTQKEDDVCFGTQKEDDVCFGTQKEDDVCFGTQKEDDVCFGTHKEDDVCFGTHKEDDVCFGTQKEDDVCFGTQKEDDVCFGTQKEDDVCFGTQKEDDVCFGTQKEDDVCFGTQKEDDVCFGTQKEDDVCFGTQKEDDVCFGTQKEDDVCFGTQKEDDVCFGTQKEDDVCFGTQKEDDVCFGTQKEDDVCFGTQKEDDVCFGTQKEDDVCFSTQKKDDVCFGTQKEDDVCFGTQKGDDVCFGTQKGDDVCFGTHKEDDVCFGTQKEDGVCFGTQKEDGMKNGAKYHWQYINIHHAVFDLQQVRKIVCDMLNQPVLNSLAEEHDNSLLLKMANIGQDLQACEEQINKKPIKDKQTSVEDSVEVQITYESIKKRLPCEECDKTDRDKSCDVKDNIDQKLDRHLLSLAKQIIVNIDNILDKFS